MFPYLSAGEVRRTLSASDLSIIDAAESGSPEPLLAGNGPSAVNLAAVGALFGSGVSPIANLSAGGGLAAAGPAVDWSNGSASRLIEVASIANRRWLGNLFAGDGEELSDLGQELASEAGEAAQGLCQVAVDAVHSFFG